MPLFVPDVDTATGSVTSVGLAAPAQFAVTGTPVTSSGTLNLAWAAEAANFVLAGPTTGVATTPSFRVLVAADVPALDAGKITTGLLSAARGGTGVDTSTAANGQLLIGTGTGLSLATLTAGTNINVTNTAGHIQIDFTGTASSFSPLTTKGDLWGYTTTNARLPVGTDNQFLVADSTQALGLGYRGLLAADVPALDASKVTTGTLALARGGTATDNSSISANLVWAGPGTGVASSAGYRPLVSADIPSPLTIAGAMTGSDFAASGLSGATQASRYVGATASGAPVSGTFAIGDFVVDQSGTIWVCTAAGAPGTWSQLIPASQKSAASGVAALSAQTALTGTTAVAVRCHDEPLGTPGNGISIPNAVYTTLTFNTNEFDQGTSSPQHSTTTNSSRLTCQVAGIYLIHANIDFNSNATGSRRLVLQLNGVMWIAWQDVGANPSGNTSLSVSTTYALSVGDYVEAQVYQDSGAALVMAGWATGQDSPGFGMARVA